MNGSFAFLDMLGGPEILLIMVVVLIFFGGEKMPGFARGLGKAIRELKKAASDVENEFKRAMDESEKHPPAPPRPAINVTPPKTELPPGHSVSIPPPPAHAPSRLPDDHYEGDPGSN